MHDDAEELKRLSARVDALEREVAQLKSGVVAAAPPTPPATAAPAPALAQTPPAAPARVPAPAPKRDVESIVGGRGLLYVGAFLIVVGVAWFLQIAFSRGWIGPSIRVAMGVIAGAALIAAGTAFRKRLHPGFADVLVGMGGALEYLALFAAGTLFSLMPLPAVFVGTIVVTATLCVLAYTGNRQPLSHLGVVGGVISPLLLGSSTSNDVMLFTYLSVLSAGAIALGELRGWRAVPIVALAGSAFYWLVLSFSTEQTSTYTLTVRITIAVVLYAVFASTTVIAWARREVIDGWRIAVASLNAAWFFLGVPLLASKDYTILAVLFMAIAALHLLAGARLGQRAQFWLATIALAFAIPPVCYSFSPFLPREVVIGAIHLGWVVEATCIGVLAARTADRVLLWFSGALFGTVVIHQLGTLDYVDMRVLLNERFVSYAAAAAGVWIVRREVRAHLGARPVFSALTKIAFDLLVLIAASPEAYRIGELLQPHNTDAGGSVAISIVWALYGATLVSFGISGKDAVRRWEGLALLGITVVKVFAVDLTGFDVVFRVVSALALGLVMLVVAFLYQKRLRAPSQGADPS